VTAVGGLVALLVPPVVSQTQQLFGVLPKFMASWERAIDDFVRTRVPALASVWKPGEHTLLVAIYEQAGSMFGNVVPKVFSIVHAVINVFSVAVMAIYLSLYPGIYREWLIALFPPLHRDLVRDVLSDLAETLRSWIVGQLLAMFVLAMLTALGLWILNVPYWLTFGVFTGAVAIVPFFGTLVSTTLPALFVLSGPGGGTKALLVILLGTVIHVLEGNLVVPLITAKKVDLPPVLTILAVLIVGKLLGPAGLLVAVPMLAVIMVLVRRILINRIYEGQGFRRTARDHALVLRVPVPEGGVVLPGVSSIDVIALSERAPLPRSA
jgi:predicted PurR-regulated permease PerM